MSDSSELRQGWAYTTLGAVRVEGAQSIEPSRHPDQQFELYSVPSFDSGLPEIVYGQAVGSNKQVVQPGTVLLCKINPRINRAWVVGDFSEHTKIASTEWIPFFPASGIEPKYLAYFLRQAAVRDFLAQNASGVGGSLMRINTHTIENYPFQVAPLSEQRRIVAAIEQQFTRLDAGMATLRRVRAALKRYRAAVLNAAVEGTLTEAWRRENPDTEPASALLGRILAERRAKWEADLCAQGKNPNNARYEDPKAQNAASLPGLPDGWCWASVEMLGDVQLGRQRAPKYHTGSHMRPYLRVANVFEDRIDTSDVMAMNFTPSEFEVYQLQYGDILLNEGQSLELVGRPAMYRDEVPGACFQNTLVRFRAYPGMVPEYALTVFRAYLHNKRFQQIGRHTTNIAHLGAGRFAELEVPLPPQAELAQIVSEVARRLSLVGALEATVEADLRRAEHLRQSILERAFSGQLVPQDPNDELASMLLERIRQERQVTHRTRGQAPDVATEVESAGKAQQGSLW